MAALERLALAQATLLAVTQGVLPNSAPVSGAHRLAPRAPAEA